MLTPKKTKFRKSHKGRRGGKASRMNKVSFGSYGLKSLEAHWITSRQIEAARKVLSKFTKKGGKVFIRIFPDQPVTQKGGEIPMGKGKGTVDHYVAKIKLGTVILELEGLSEEVSKEALNLATYKLPIKCKVVAKV